MTEEETKAAGTETAKAEELHNEEVKAELAKAEERKQRTEKERAEYNLKKKIEEAKKLGIDPKSFLGNDEEETPSDDEIPSWYKREQAKSSQKTALQLADGIADADERALVKEHLTNRIIPSGDPESDLRLAWGAVSALKNKQILEQISRRPEARTTASGGSSPAKHEAEFIPTADEQYMMTNFKVPKEKIIEARRREADKQR